LVAVVVGTDLKLQSVAPSGPTGPVVYPVDHDPLFEIESAPSPPPICHEALPTMDRWPANAAVPMGGTGSAGGNPSIATSPEPPAPRAAAGDASGLGSSGLGTSGLTSPRPLPSYLAPPAVQESGRGGGGRRPATAAATVKSEVPISITPWAIATASAGLVLVVGAGVWILAGLAAKAMYVPPLLLVIGLIVICRALWGTSK
jgi:hypothetical protein